MGSVNEKVHIESGNKELNYPVAKILDMIFWEYGYKLKKERSH